MLNPPLRRQRRRSPPSVAVPGAAAQVPPGCSRYSVELRKPLGLLLEEDRSGGIFVASVVQGGNADCCGLVGKVRHSRWKCGWVRVTLRLLTSVEPSLRIRLCINMTHSWRSWV